MKHPASDFLRGLILAVPVLALAGLGAREYVGLRYRNQMLEAQRLDALAVSESAMRKLAEVERHSRTSIEVRMRETAQAAASQGAAEERLNNLIEFLKSEVTTTEAALHDLKNRGAPPSAERVGQLMAEISRLNSELEKLEEDRDRWKRAAQRP